MGDLSTVREALERSLQARLGICNLDELLVADELLLGLERRRHECGALQLRSLEIDVDASRDLVVEAACLIVAERRVARSDRTDAIAELAASSTERSRPPARARAAEVLAGLRELRDTTPIEKTDEGDIETGGES